MNATLTLTIDKEVIEQAKQYAHREGRSLSNLIESYLRSLITEHESSFEMSPIVRSLRGSCKVPDGAFDYDYDSILENELLENYRPK